MSHHLVQAKGATAVPAPSGPAAGGVTQVGGVTEVPSTANPADGVTQAGSVVAKPTG